MYLKAQTMATTTTPTTAPELLIIWDSNYRIADEDVWDYVEACVDRAETFPRVYTGNQLVVDALRAQRKQGKLSRLSLDVEGGHMEAPYEVLADGDWQQWPSQVYWAQKKIQAALAGRES